MGPYINFPHFGNSSLGKLPDVCPFLDALTVVQGSAFRVKIILVAQLGTVILTPYQARGKTEFLREFEVGSYQAGIHRDLI